MSVGAYATLAHAAIDELVARTGIAVVSGGTGLYLRAALADLDVPPPPGAGVRERILRRGRARPGGGARAARGPRSARSRGRPRERPAAPRPRARARRGGRIARTGRRPPLGEHDPAPDRDRRARGSARRARARGSSRAPRRCSSRVSWRRCGRRSRRGVSRTAAKTLGLDEIATLPEDEARERIVIRTRRYAAYQRKWMRRIPGLVRVDGTRPVDEIAASIIEAASSRVRRLRSRRSRRPPGESRRRVP